MADVKIFIGEVAEATSYEIQRSDDLGENWTSIYIGSEIEFLDEDLVDGEYKYRTRAINPDGQSDWLDNIQINVGVTANPNMEVVDLLDGQTLTDNTYTSADNSMGSSSTWQTYNSIDVAEFSDKSYLVCFYARINNTTISDTVVPIVGVYENDTTVKILELKTPNSTLPDYHYAIVPAGIKLLSFTSKRASGWSMKATAYFDENKPTTTTFSGNITTEELSLNGMGTSIANNVNSHQSNVFVTDSGDIYIALIGDDTYLKILKKEFGSPTWETYDFNGGLVNPFGATARDAHMHYSIVVTKDGFVIVSGNMHGGPCRAVISTAANDITEWETIDYTLGHSQVTYPTFVQLNNGDTYAVWRRGGSSDSNIFISKFNDLTNEFEDRLNLISGGGSVGVYKNKVIIDQDDNFHISWGLRNESGSGETTSGVWYMKSEDGVNWTQTDGTPITLPANSSNAERIYVAEEGTGIINQNSSCVDGNGIYHTVFWQRDSNQQTQVIHSWYDEGVWSSERLTHLIINEDLSSGSLSGRLLRPQIAYFNSIGKTLAFFNTQEYDAKGKVTFVDVVSKEVFRHTLIVGSSELEGFYKDGKHHMIHGNLSTSNASEFISVDMFYTIIG